MAIETNLSFGERTVSKFIQLVEQGDNSIHYVNLDEIVQVVHVPNSKIAMVHLTNGMNFRVGEAEIKHLIMTAFNEQGPAAQTKGAP